MIKVEGIYRPAPCIEVTGIDGAGKSTIVASISAGIGWRAKKVRPFDSAAVSQDRRIYAALGESASYDYRSCALGAALLREASDLTEPAVFDRYKESALMWWHVNATRPLGEGVLASLPPPCLVIYLETPVEVGLERRLTTTEHTDDHEQKFMLACAEYLSQRARVGANWVSVDATRPLAEVQDACITHAREASVAALAASL